MEGDPAGFNFIATTFKGVEREAARECASLLRGFGDAAPSVSTTDVAGLVLGRTSLEPLEVVRKLKEAMEGDPWSVRLVLRFIPVEEVVTASPSSVEACTARHSLVIAPDDTFRVTVEKRHNSTPSSAFIEAAASAVKAKVDLEAPDWVVLVEVIGESAGVSVIKPSSIFSSPKAKRGE